MKKETVEAIVELGKAVAKKMGLEEDAIEMSVCRHTEPNVCDKQCVNCEGQTHHWIGGTSRKDNESSVWHCEHCDYEIPQEDTSSHPSGCDCPDCLPDKTRFLETKNRKHCFLFVCEGCGVIGEIEVPIEVDRFSCPDECGAIYCPWLNDGVPDLMCVVKPFFVTQEEFEKEIRGKIVCLSDENLNETTA